MKKLALALTLALFGGQSLVMAQEKQETAIVQTTEDQKEEITVDQLPEPVVKAFTESEYSAWELGKVYQVTKSEDNSIYFLFEVSQGDEEKELKIDAEGNIMKDEAEG